MAPLYILPLLFGLIFLINKYILNNRLSLSLTGLVPISIMLITIGTAHFFYTDLMVQMIPDFIPIKREVIYITGIFELMASIGLLIKRLRFVTSVLLIIFLVAVLPANINGSIKQLPFGGMESGKNFLYLRIPMQLFFISWIYWFGIRCPSKAVKPVSNHSL